MCCVVCAPNERNSASFGPKVTSRCDRTLNVGLHARWPKTSLRARILLRLVTLPTMQREQKHVYSTSLFLYRGGDALSSSAHKQNQKLRAMTNFMPSTQIRRNEHQKYIYTFWHIRLVLTANHRRRRRCSPVVSTQMSYKCHDLRTLLGAFSSSSKKNQSSLRPRIILHHTLLRRDDIRIYTSLLHLMQGEMPPQNTTYICS